MKASWPAPERNKGPILDVLSRVLPKTGTLLEIASGTGQHAVHFARHLPGLTWIPSDPDAANIASIREWVGSVQLPNLREPLTIDVRSSDWGAPQVEAIFNANMLHITSWDCAIHLFAGVRRHLARDGVVVLYGPYRIGGEHTAPSNAAFDQELRQRDASWGVRDLEAVVELAASGGLVLQQRVAMPANNLSLVFGHAG